MLRVAALLAAAARAAAAPQKPNIVFFLTDDQDQMLGGSFPPHNGITPLPKANALLAEQGATATNMFIHTPICCPSRSETLTGRYFHNLKSDGKCLVGYGSGGCCFHVDYTKVENNTFAKTLNSAGYKVGLFGKYLNTWPSQGSSPAPPGFDAWLANGGGTYYAPEFDAQGIADLGFPDGHWAGKADDYTTAVVGNASMAWIRKVAPTGAPFFAYIAPKACHEEFAPAQWYKDYWHPSWPATEPRPVSWNASAESRQNHHKVIARAPLINPGEAEQITLSFKDRWRTLMSVDDVISDVVRLTEELKVLEHTYFFYSSDHGFQLGEFNLPIDKRHVYDYDTRIHLLVRGPGVKAASTFSQLATNVDLAPTFLGLAGLPQPADMDGKSLLPLLVDPAAPGVPPSTRSHLAALPGGEGYRAAWRDVVFIEYYYVNLNTKCMPYAPLDPVSGQACRRSDPNCTCTDIEDASNNYIALRHVEGEYGNTLYAEFQTDGGSDVYFDQPDFYEYFDMAKDPWSMHNLYNNSGANRTVLQQLHNKLHMWFQCKGSACP
eukprot:TRINITY_DN47774_c0_g1_i1.p1 TRINITY_DN47774_c0_g1~~TRINITY_DN47774_c0_g1_i1.p1  ORF type:complete len:549 (+),score=210.56 TRINITY_DN47774_c0_g1_i1:81-1727(+)